MTTTTQDPNSFKSNKIVPYDSRAIEHLIYREQSKKEKRSVAESEIKLIEQAEHKNRRDVLLAAFEQSSSAMFSQLGVTSRAMSAMGKASASTSLILQHAAELNRTIRLIVNEFEGDYTILDHIVVTLRTLLVRYTIGNFTNGAAGSFKTSKNSNDAEPVTSSAHSASTLPSIPLQASVVVVVPQSVESLVNSLPKAPSGSTASSSTTDSPKSNRDLKEMSDSDASGGDDRSPGCEKEKKKKGAFSILSARKKSVALTPLPVGTQSTRKETNRANRSVLDDVLDEK